MLTTKIGPRGRHCLHYLEEEMGRHQYNNTFNNLKGSMVTPESSGLMTGRSEYPNPEEAEKNDLKYNFMKVIETLKEETKNSLKVMEEKTNQ